MIELNDDQRAAVEALQRHFGLRLKVLKALWEGEVLGVAVITPTGEALPGRLDFTSDGNAYFFSQAGLRTRMSDIDGTAPEERHGLGGTTQTKG